MIKIIFLFLVLVLFNLSAIFNVAMMITKFNMDMITTIPVSVASLLLSDFIFIRYIKVKIIEYKDNLSEVQE